MSNYFFILYLVSAILSISATIALNIVYNIPITLKEFWLFIILFSCIYAGGLIARNHQFLYLIIGLISFAIVMSLQYVSQTYLRDTTFSILAQWAIAILAWPGFISIMIYLTANSAHILHTTRKNDK
jgi:hypothetical protein